MGAIVKNTTIALLAAAGAAVLFFSKKGTAITPTDLYTVPEFATQLQQQTEDVTALKSQDTTQADLRKQQTQFAEQYAQDILSANLTAAQGVDLINQSGRNIRSARGVSGTALQKGITGTVGGKTYKGQIVKLPTSSKPKFIGIRTIR